MPTYQYRCSDCGYEFDQYQKFSDNALTVCPSCSGSIRRVIQPVGVVFKGSGWYINDSKSTDKPGTAKKADAPAAEKSEPATAAEAMTGENAAKPEKSEAKESPAPAKTEKAAPAPASA